jgi:hypothetical protein
MAFDARLQSLRLVEELPRFGNQAGQLFGRDAVSGDNEKPNGLTGLRHSFGHLGPRAAIAKRGDVDHRDLTRLRVDHVTHASLLRKKHRRPRSRAPVQCDQASTASSSKK